MLFPPPWDAVLAPPTPPSLRGCALLFHWWVKYKSILSISADIETVGEILLKIIPTLEEVRTCLVVFPFVSVVNVNHSLL